MTTIPALTALRYFEAAARLGGVTPAARELHVTHSAVSQQIRVLEEGMGVALFEREARGLRLTEAGRLYALEIRGALRRIGEATQQAQARPQESELVVATLPSFAAHWLLPRLARLRERHPHYRVRLQTSLDLQDLRHGQADVGIRMGQGNWPGLGQQRLFADELVVVAAPALNGGRLPASAQEIIAAPLIHSTDAPWSDWCRAAGVEPPSGLPALAANDSNVVMAALLLGQGVALERRSVVAAALASGALVQLSAVCVRYPYAYWLVWPQRDVMDAKQQQFIQWMLDEAADYLP